MKSRYPRDWPAILNNAAVLLAFGFSHYAMASDLAEVLGIEARDLMKLQPEQAMLSVTGEGIRAVRRLNYLRDAMFENKFDPNPFFQKDRSTGR